jgi:chromate transporter
VTDLAWLTWTFLWLSFLSIGGGLGVLPELQRQVVHVHQWVTAQQFVDGYALAQLTPGPSMLVAVFIGYRAHGFLGALLAGAAMFAPSSVLAALAARQWSALRERPWARVAERVITPVGIGLMAGGAYTLLRSGVHDVPTAAIALVALAALWLRVAPPIVVVVLGGLAGWFFGV